MTTYDAMLFDNDGVLVEPPATETQLMAARSAFAEVGVADPDPDAVETIVGGVSPDELHAIAGRYDVDPAALWDARERHDERSQIEAFRAGERGLYDDVSALDSLSHRSGVVSNNHHTTVEFVLDHFDLGSLFDTYYGRPMTVESLRRKKPNTHYVERALADVGAESALYVGDSESDVVAAHRAGMDSAFVRRPGWASAELSETPTYDVADLHGVVDIV